MFEAENTWIDVDACQLITQERALEMEAADKSAAVIRVLEVLMVDEAPEMKQNPDTRSSVGYTIDDSLEFGYWLGRTLTEHFPETIPEFRIGYLRRLGQLGIGPGVKRTRTLHGAIENFAVSIGTRPRVNERFDSWGEAEWLDYHQRLETAVGRRPRNYDYDRYRGILDGPSRNKLERSPFSLSYLNEQRGYPSMRNMMPDDMAYWGSLIMEANSSRAFTPELINALSAIDRCMSMKNVYKNFTDFPEFRRQCRVELEFELKSRQDRENRLMDAYEGYVSEGILDSLTVGGDVKKRMMAAKCMLARDVIPGATPDRLRRLAEMNTKRFLADLEGSAKLTEAECEIAAVELGILEEIKPMRRWQRELRVTDAMLQAVVATRERPESRRLRRQRQNDSIAAYAGYGKADQDRVTGRDVPRLPS